MPAAKKPYTITLTVKTRGIATQNPLWLHRRVLRVAPVLVITGNNGSGKTALLKAVAAGIGIDPSAMSLSESKRDSFWTSKPTSEFGVVSNSFKPHEAVLHSPVDQIHGRGSIESMMDIRRAFAQNRSHGEMLQGLLLSQLAALVAFLKEPKNKDKCVMHLIDEPEAAASLETMINMQYFMGTNTKYLMDLAKAGKKPRAALFVATQNPELVKIMTTNGAQRLDLGGWKKGDPFEPFLKEMT